MKKEKSLMIAKAADFYIQHIPTFSLTEVGKKFGIDRRTISREIKSRNIDIVNHQNICRLDETIFDIIDTEEKAYWLGFIFADGCVYRNEDRFRINLSIKDRNHLEKFAAFLKFKGVIGINTVNRDEKTFKLCYVSFRNKHICDRLKQYGCTSNKSLTLKFPDISIFKTNNLVIDFIRGYFDGDGSLGLCKTSTKSKKEFLSLLGTKEFLQEIRKYLNISTKVKNKSTANHSNNAFTINTSCLTSRKIARIIYGNATIYLDRKYNIYKEFCRREEESSRLLSSKDGES